MRVNLSLKRQGRMATVFRCALFCILAFSTLFSNQSLAHGVAHERVHAIGHQIENDKNNPTLYIKRGRIYIDSEHWQQAINDFKTAQTLHTTPSDADYWLAYSYFQLNNLPQANDYLASYLNAKPKAPAANALKARILAKQGRYPQAENYFQKAIQWDSQPPPQINIDRLAALSQNPDITAPQLYAIFKTTLLDQGVIISTLDGYYRVFTERNQPTYALKVIDALPQSMADIPQWQLNKIHTLLALSRQQEARVLAQNLLTYLEQKPAHKQTSVAFLQLKQQTTDYIHQLNAHSFQLSR